jgi:protein-tyrosine phosphatase
MSDFLQRRKMSYIPDPYYMGVEGFALVLDLLEDGCQNLFDAIVKSEF